MSLVSSGRLWIPFLIASFLNLIFFGCSAKDSSRLAQVEPPTPENVELKPISVIAGILGSSRLNSPSGFILDHSGNIYILDGGNNRLVKLSPEGRFSKEVGGFGGGVNQFRQPSALAFDGGINILVADSQNRRLVRFDRNLNFAGSIDTYLDMSQTERNFGLMAGIKFTNQGDILLSDTEEDRILKLDGFYNMSGEFGGFGYGFGQLREPAAIVIDAQDRVYVADSGNGRIAVFNPFGKFLWSIGEEELVTPKGLEIDKSGFLWVGDVGRGRVVVFSKEGRFLKEFGGGDDPRVTFSYPTSVRVSSENRLYVLDGREGSLKIFEIMR
jgi:DNA-binding beta-propeller fold protein YncE